ncbi:MAG: hypothetical protein ACM3MK_05685 [Chitinophagales bacterium]
MSKLEKLLVVIGLIVTVLFAHSLLSREPYQGNIADPVQQNLTNVQIINTPGEDGDVQISLLAEYNIEAVVKGKRKYSDYPSQVSKYDFALAWGDLNEKEIDKNIKYSQSGRWYYYRYSDDTPVSGEYIANHSANVHLIHKDKDILNEIKKIRVNEHVRLQGYLVSVNFKNGPWKSSLSRTDTGNGSCEIMYVTDIETIE